MRTSSARSVPSVERWHAGTWRARDAGRGHPRHDRRDARCREVPRRGSRRNEPRTPAWRLVLRGHQWGARCSLSRRVEWRESGSLTLTGHLGEVMKESARAALSWFRAHASKYDVDPSFYKDAEIHLHVPSGAIPKDGPSAGVTMVTALISELTGRRCAETWP